MEFPNFGFEIVPRTERPPRREKEGPLSLVNTEAMNAVHVVRLYEWAAVSYFEFYVPFQWRTLDNNPYANAYDDLSDEIFNLPIWDPAQARKVFAGLAMSKLSLVRRLTGNNLRNLTKYDTAYALVLWDRLLRDPIAQVRQATYRHLEGLSLGACKHPDDPLMRLKEETLLADVNLTRKHFVELETAYLNAELGNLCDFRESLPDIPMPE